MLLEDTPFTGLPLFNFIAKLKVWAGPAGPQKGALFNPEKKLNGPLGAEDGQRFQLFNLAIKLNVCWPIRKGVLRQTASQPTSQPACLSVKMASLSSKTVGELTVAELQQLLQSLSVAQPQVSKKAKKDPSAPKKEVSAGVAAWNAYVTEVKEELGCSRKEAMAEASKRRAAGDAEYAAASEARRAKRDEQLAKKAGSVPPSPEKPAAASPEKPKKVLSPEHLAKMQAAAKASRLKREEAKKAAAPAPKAPEPEAEAEEWIRKSISGKKHLWNPSNNHCYRCEADGSQGEWAGLYDPKTGKIDDSVEEPVEFEELPLCADCEKEPVTAKGHRYCEGCK